MEIPNDRSMGFGGPLKIPRNPLTGYLSLFRFPVKLQPQYVVCTHLKAGRATKELLRNTLGYNGEQIKIVEENPKWRKLAEAGPIMMSKKMVATCVKA